MKIIYLFLLYLPLVAQAIDSAKVPTSLEDQQMILNATPDKQLVEVQSQIVTAQAKRIEWLNKELIRIRTCYKASIPFDECGPLAPDGSIVIRLAKPTAAQHQ